MIITYNPELNNPPSSPETGIGFSFIGGGIGKETRHVRFEPGTNHDIDPAVWDELQAFEEIQRLLSLGALKVIERSEEAPAPASLPTSLADYAINDALDVVSATHDEELLTRWEREEKRIKVRNALSRRLAEVKEGRA